MVSGTRPSRVTVGGIAVDQTRRVQQIGNPDLVGRKTIAHRITDVLSVKPNQCARRPVGTNRVDEDDVVRFGEQSEKRKAECAAIRQLHAGRDAVLGFQARDRGRAKPVIAEQDVAQCQERERRSSFPGRIVRVRCSRVVCFSLWQEFVAGKNRVKRSDMFDDRRKQHEVDVERPRRS